MNSFTKFFLGFFFIVFMFDLMLIDRKKNIDSMINLFATFNKIDGLNVIKPPHNDLANAVGAAIAQVSGQVSKVILIDDKIDRESAIKQVTDEATKLAVDRDADPNTINVLAVSDMPLSYLPGNNLLINVTVVGDLKMENK